MTVVIARKPAAAAKAPAAPVAPVAKAFAFTGKGAKARNDALLDISTLAFIEGKSRAEMIASMRVALGKSPSADEVNAVKLRYVVGRSAQRFGPADLPRKDMSPLDRIAHAMELIVNYAAPVKDGTKARSIGSKKGRRTPSQDTIIRNAEKSWSLVAAELGLGAAQTQDEKNAKQTRSPAMKGATKRGKAPSHSELVKAPDAPKSAKDCIAFVASQSTMLMQFCKKNAGLAPVELGLAVNRFNECIAQLLKEAK